MSIHSRVFALFAFFLLFLAVLPSSSLCEKTLPTVEMEWTAWITLDDATRAENLTALTAAIEKIPVENGNVLFVKRSTFDSLQKLKSSSTKKDIFVQFVADLRNLEESINSLNDELTTAEPNHNMFPSENSDQSTLLFNRYYEELNTDNMNELDYSVDCYTDDENWATGRVKSTLLGTYEDGDNHITCGNDIIGNRWRGYSTFNVSNIPDDAIITGIILYCYTRNTSTSPSHMVDVKEISLDPRDIGGLTLWNAIGSGSFLGGNWTAMHSMGWHSIALNAVAISDLEDHLGTNYWWVGFLEQGDNSEYGEFEGFDRIANVPPYIHVVYDRPLVASPTDIVFPSGGGSYALSIRYSTGNPIPPELYWTQNEPGWLDFDYNLGNLIVTAGVNSGTYREGTFRVYAIDTDPSFVTVNVSQEAGSTTLNISPDYFDFPAEGGSRNLQITIGGGDPNASWTIPNTGWVTVDPHQGSGSQTVEISVDSNQGEERERVLSVNGDETQPSSRPFTVNQEAGSTTLDVSPDELNFSDLGGTQTFSVQIAGGNPNASWSIVGDQGLIEISPSTGNGTTTVSASVGSNTGDAIDLDLTVIGVSTSPPTATVQIHQDANTNFSPEELWGGIPSEFSIASIFPNPFNPTVTIVIGVPESSELMLSVYNTLGKKVGSLAEGMVPAGHHRFLFEASNLSGGVYFIHASIPGHANQVKKIVMMK